MEDMNLYSPTPAEEDPTVHRYLLALPSLAPLPGFEDRIMERVWLPRPQWLRTAQDYWQHLVESGRIWLVVGPFSVSTFAACSALIALLVTYITQVEAALSWLINTVAPAAWHAANDYLAGVAAAVSADLGAYLPSGTILITTAVGMSALWIVCAWGLYQTMNIPKSARIPLHGTR